MMKSKYITSIIGLTSIRNDVTFLYTLGEGVCPKSYGMNVAIMAGVEEKVVKRAEEMAQLFDEISNKQKRYR
jgi:DNA mismatch repair protein MSH6